MRKRLDEFLEHATSQKETYQLKMKRKTVSIPPGILPEAFRFVVSDKPILKFDNTRKKQL